MKEAHLPPLSLEPFEPLLGRRRWRRLVAALAAGRETMQGRTLWHVSSTLTGGGVAELLTSVLAYMRGAGITARWIAMDGSEEFFVVTKRIHHLLHGRPGDGKGLSDEDRRCYLDVVGSQLAELSGQVRPGDVAVLHDPQAAGLAPGLRERGARLIWNCHIGADQSNDRTRLAWRMLQPFVSACDVAVFSRRCYVWPDLDSCRVSIIPPCIDALSPKNEELTDRQVRSILAAAGIVAPSAGSGGEPTYRRSDGELGRVSARADTLQEGEVPADAPVVTQISRWDPLKDHAGLAAAFEDVPASLGAHLVLAGPSPEGVSDDPEGDATRAAVRERWHALPPRTRNQVHVASLPMGDIEENAAVVNALQRRSQVVVQKSLAEGFGLTVAEALWKERPMVASRVGGIQDQIDDGESGVLVDSPSDLAGFARAIEDLLNEPASAQRMGRQGKAVVTERYLAPGFIERHLELAGDLARRD